MLSAITDATRAFSPAAFSRMLVNASTPAEPCWLIISAMPAAGSSPKIAFKYSMRSALPRSSVAWATSARICGTLRMLPSASLMLRPSSSMAPAAAPVGAESRSIMARRVVPAWLPWMPTLPSRPAMAADSSSDSPISRATGATYFIDSPSISRLTLARVVVAVMTSPRRSISLGSSPNPESRFEAMSDVRPRPVSLALARSSIEGMAARMASGSKPAMARKPWASAAWVALNEVLEPSSRA